MQIQLSASDGVPIYLQLVQQIKHLIAVGRLNAADQLPSVRKLSEQLVINPNTVARAYRELEMAGVLCARAGAGVFVSETAEPLAKRDQHRLLVERLDAVLEESRHLGLAVEDVVQLVRQRARAVKPTA